VRHTSEAVGIKRGQRFMGSTVIGEPYYRTPRRGRSVGGAEPLRLDMSHEGVGIQSNSDVFPMGVRYYDFPPTIRKLSWRGGILATRQTLTRILDDEGEHIRQETDRGIFGLYTGIIDNPGGPKWLDSNRAIKARDRRRVCR